MNVPKVVQDQADKSAKIMEEINKNPEEIVEGIPVEDKPLEAPIEPEVKKEEVIEEAPKEDYEQKYKTLKGKYDREIPALQEELERVRGTVDNLNALIVELNTGKKIGTEEPVKEKPAIKAVNPADFEDYGDEVVGLANTVNTLLGELDDIKTKFGDVQNDVGSVKNTVAKTAEEKFEDALTQLVPDWKTKDKDMGWKQWLSEADEFSGIERQQLLMTAYGKRDAKSVANFFNTYFKKDDEPKPEHKEEHPLEEQVIPKSISASTDNLPKGEMVTDTQYQNAIARARAGKISSVEFDKITRNYMKSKRAAAK